MPNYLRAYYVRAEGDQDEAGKPLRFVASTEGIKRDGKELRAENWQLENYQRNPVVLWVHDYMGNNLPVGRANAFVEGKELLADVTFDQEDQFARSIESKYRRGFLNAVSVGWEDIGQGQNIKHELLDISAVPVPGDADALMERQLRGLADVGKRLAELADENADGEPVWEDTAIVMMRLFDPSVQMPERDRKRLYNSLERRYRKLGKTAPGYMPADQLVTLGGEELRGLFLEGEPDLWPGLFANERVGAVLNARNRQDLEQAITLVQAVLDRAKKEAKDDDAQDTERGIDDFLTKLRALPAVK